MTQVSHILRLTAVSVVLLTGCSGSAEPAKPDWSALPTVDHPAAPPPETRDQADVWASLARLDPCALLDPGAAKVKGFPADLPREARDPHACEIERPADAYEVQVHLGVELGAADRYSRARVELGGATAYIASRPRGAMCKVALPVSDVHVIEFSGDADRVSCPETRGFATAAARRLLRDPASAERGPGPGRRVPCDLLSSAVGKLPPNRVLRSGTDWLTGIDRCGVWQGSGPKLALSGQQLQPVAPEAYLSLEYTDSARDHFADGYLGAFEQLRGTEVFVDGAPRCEVSWEAWAADLPDAQPGDVALATVEARNCRRAKRIATGVMATVERPAPSYQPIPQLPYRPDQPDTGAPGPCADLAEQAARECAPHVDVDVPDDPVELIRHVEADANVGCAATRDAVQEIYGDTMQPVTATGVGPVVLDEDDEPLSVRDCVFVEPTHQLVVAVRFSSDPLARETGDEIAGHPAAAEEESSDAITQQQRWVALDRADERGHLWLSVTVQPHRRTGMFSNSPVDEAPLDEVDALAALVVGERLE